MSYFKRNIENSNMPSNIDSLCLVVIIVKQKDKYIMPQQLLSIFTLGIPT